MRPVPFFVLLSLPLHAFAGAVPHAAAHERGWFWYEPLPPVEVATKQDESPPPNTPPSSPPSVPLGSAWLRKHLPIYLDRAIDSPTLDNVRRYRYLERLAMDRGSAYSDASARLTLLDPLLDEQQVSPLTALAKATRHRELDAKRQQLLTTITRDAGLWFFFRSDCTYCHAQVAALEGLQRHTGVRILPISVDGLPLVTGAYPDFVTDQGQATRLGVTQTPSLHLVHRDGRVLPLATGLQTRDQIEFRLIELGHELGFVSEAEFADVQPLQHTLLDDVAATLPADTSPETLIDILIQRGAGELGRGTPLTTTTEAHTP